MRRIFFILILFYLKYTPGYSQPLKVEDLVKLSSTTPKGMISYLNRKGFFPQQGIPGNDTMVACYVEKKKKKFNNSLKPTTCFEFYKNGDTDIFVLRSGSMQDFKDGCNWLNKENYFSAENKDSSQVLFQKKYVVVLASSPKNSQEKEYIFRLERKKMPEAGEVYYADDLMKFTSHEFLATYFGKDNVKKDVYYFSEHELKQCSVLFPNTDRQAVFIWNDEMNLNHLFYVLISGITPSKNNSNYNGSISQNKWKLKNGIYSGITLKELRDINGDDFQFYGKKSEFLYMVSPESTGNIDFKRTGLTMDCFNCKGSVLLEKQKISANEAIKNSLALYVVYIMLLPQQ